MKTLQRICAVTILSLTLAGSALAGHIDTPGAPAPLSSTNYPKNVAVLADNTGGNYDANITITGSIVQMLLNVIYR